MSFSGGGFCTVCVNWDKNVSFCVGALGRASNVNSVVKMVVGKLLV